MTKHGNQGISLMIFSTIWKLFLFSIIICFFDLREPVNRSIDSKANGKNMVLWSAVFTVKKLSKNT